jgi:tRNA(Ile)-lysidine synthase
VRPLLSAPPEEIAAYARRQRVPFVVDASNRDLARPRNWVRHRLIPLAARRLNRNLLKSLARLAR